MERLTKRTDQEILARIDEIQGGDFFGVGVGNLIGYLDFDAARPFLLETATRAQWEANQRESLKKPSDEIRAYLPFAWGKANGCRGLSASRSIDHFRSWLWLDGVEWADEIAEYDQYGKPQLVRISEHYGVDWRALDDGRWRSSEMEEGISADEALGRSAESKRQCADGEA